MSTKKISFNRSVFIVLGGNVLSQGLIFASSPLLTRLYSPEVFGQLAVFISVVAMINVFTSLKYELALPLERDQQKFLNLVVLCLGILGGTTIICTAAVFILGFFFFEKQFAEFLFWLLPLAFLGEGITAITNYYGIHKSKYKDLAILKVNKSLFTVGGQAGLYSLQSVGLVAGDVMGRILGGFKLMMKMFREIRKSANLISLNEIREVAGKYRKFPLISSYSSFINSAGLQLAPILLSAMYSQAEVGLFALAQRVIVSPLSIIGRAVADVFYGTAAKIETPGELQRMFIKTSFKLLLVGMIPIGILYFAGESLFGLIFGNAWKETGTIIQILSLMYLAQFIVSPLSQTLNILNRQDLQLIWDIVRLILTVVPFLAGFLFEYDFYQLIRLFGICSVASYALLYGMIFRVLKKQR
ncbi:lipopolysaccharide biosynthesis protein [Bacillus sp. FJAT-27245]|uniref:lipopolysaccharide biosynthesis protein n=1 Tax=Bacillus sp. FJAT-27245 TaxID=1684144 RepID=UPI0006A77936|nr:oligosaccharide flippase family protein [Bacillus sp. FJAT-27245]